MIRLTRYVRWPNLNKKSPTNPVRFSSYLSACPDLLDHYSQTARICVDKIANSPLLKTLTAHVVYVGKPNSDMTSQVIWAKELLANNGFDVIDSVLEGNVEKSILEYQEKNSIDIMVIGAYGHSKIRQFFIGSTTTKLLASSKKPVLLLR